MIESRFFVLESEWWVLVKDDMHSTGMRQQEGLHSEHQGKPKPCGGGLVARIWLLDRNTEVQEKNIF